MKIIQESTGAEPLIIEVNTINGEHIYFSTLLKENNLPDFQAAHIRVALKNTTLRVVNYVKLIKTGNDKKAFIDYAFLQMQFLNDFKSFVNVSEVELILIKTVDIQNIIVTFYPSGIEQTQNKL